MSRNEKRTQVTNVDKDLVSVTQSRPEVVISRGPSCSHLLGPQHPQHHLDMVVPPLCNERVNVHEKVENMIGLVESGLVSAIKR